MYKKVIEFYDKIKPALHLDKLNWHLNSQAPNGARRMLKLVTYRVRQIPRPDRSDKFFRYLKYGDSLRKFEYACLLMLVGDKTEMISHTDLLSGLW